MDLVKTPFVVVVAIRMYAIAKFRIVQFWKKELEARIGLLD